MPFQIPSYMFSDFPASAYLSLSADNLCNALVIYNHGPPHPRGIGDFDFFPQQILARSPTLRGQADGIISAKWARTVGLKQMVKSWVKNPAVEDRVNSMSQIKHSYYTFYQHGSEGCSI